MTEYQEQKNKNKKSNEYEELKDSRQKSLGKEL